jgi:type I restriction enzyme, S subunit
MKQGWYSESIEDLCEVEYGTRVVRKRDAGTIYLVYGGGGATFSMDTYNREDRMVIARFAMSKRCVRFVDGKFFLNDSGLTISPLDDNTFDKDFLNYQILSLNDEIYSLARGTAQKNLNVNAFKKVQLSYPASLEEQKQIVAKLDQCFEAIDKARANAAKNLENAKELFQSKLNEIFSQKGEGWVEVVLNEIGETQTGTTPPTKDISNYGDYIPFVKPPHFSPDGSINTGSSMLSKSGLEKGRLFQSNSVLMVCIGATIGKTGFSTVPVSSNQQINCLTPKKEYNPKLFYYGLISPFVQRQVIEIGSGSQATLPIINKSKWSKLRINIPTERSVQDVIVQLLDGLKQKTQPLESKYQQELNSLEELKKSILQKAFKGEL